MKPVTRTKIILTTITVILLVLFEWMTNQGLVYVPSIILGLWAIYIVWWVKKNLF